MKNTMNGLVFPLNFLLVSFVTAYSWMVAVTKSMLSAVGLLDFINSAATCIPLEIHIMLLLCSKHTKAYHHQHHHTLNRSHQFFVRFGNVHPKR